MVAKALPPVTVGIPFYNAERFLLEAIKSVFAQTHKHWELILMDDGSTDGSLNIARAINDPRVRVYSDGQNKKLAARLNEIHNLASYDFVARMDADDVMATNRLQKQLLFLEDNPECDLVTSGVCSITDDSTPYGVRTVAKGHMVTPFKVLGGAHGIVHAAVLGRKDWFLRNQYDPQDRLAQDSKLWVRSLLKNDLQIGFINEPLYYYREEGSITEKKILDGHRIGRALIKEYGPPAIGLLDAKYLLGRSYLKSAVIHAAARVGALKYVVRARSPSADESILKNAQHEINKVKMIRLDNES